MAASDISILEYMRHAGYSTAFSIGVSDMRMQRLIKEGLVAMSHGRVRNSQSAEYCITQAGIAKLAAHVEKGVRRNKLKLALQSQAIVVGRAHKARDHDAVNEGLDKLVKLADEFDEEYKDY